MKLLRRLILILPLILILGLAALFAAFWLDHRSSITLPKPTGPFPVGRTTAYWTDPADKRELLAWIWYPALSAPSGTRTAEYLPAP